MKHRSILAAVALVATTTTLAAPSGAAPSPAHERRATDPVQRALDDLVAVDGLPGAVASVRDRDGTVRTYTAGVGDLTTGAPMPRDPRVRIASNTKLFTATVVLQLVGEGLVDLDAPVERYLPGVVRGPGGDGRRITVRMLLQQTSGLPDYDTIVLDVGSLDAFAHTYVEPRQLLDAALAERRSFRPGTQWEYSNTNYVLLGLLAQRVTGRPFGELVTQRVIRRLDLRDTYWPRPGEQRIRGRHPQGYLADGADDPWRDTTRMDPSFGWSAGQLVSSPADLGRFMQGLLGGELLEPAELAAMRETVAAPGFEVHPGWRYGLGLARHRTGCGVVGWGHGGDIQGFESRNLVTDDGRWAVVVVNALPRTLETIGHVGDAVDTAICAAD
ncbi:serine hydrolase domain-containing protein [Nocardioides flavescens]|uniref:Serine hydrolase n=1 Tax=Nocardioides flavescens TaxID=2691959 RepID=A0A6L7F4A6_9ACTN|nr:serine hydrolase domain-containing protein [Nocardioides flavescens]MXG92088.1 serine hydrolase [Nocardioides flavescens]